MGMLIFNGSGVYETDTVERDGEKIIIRAQGQNVIAAYYSTDDRANEVLGELVSFLDMDEKNRADIYGTKQVYKMPVR
jgi:hypothetical protein